MDNAAPGIPLVKATMESIWALTERIEYLEREVGGPNSEPSAVLSFSGYANSAEFDTSYASLKSVDSSISLAEDNTRLNREILIWKFEIILLASSDNGVSTSQKQKKEEDKGAEISSTPTNKKNGTLKRSGSYAVSSPSGSSGRPPLSGGVTPPRQKKESHGDMKKTVYRPSSQKPRSILSIIRSFDSTMRRYMQRDELKKLPKLLEMYQKLGFMLDTQNDTLGAEGVLEDLRAKQKLVVSNMAWLEYLQDLEPNIISEVPYEATTFDEQLLKAEAAISIQTKRALEIQRAINEMALSYNKIVIEHIKLEETDYSFC
eukprot:jgi/Bigna1/84314/fgenesh1_pg.129_\